MEFQEIGGLGRETGERKVFDEALRQDGVRATVASKFKDNTTKYPPTLSKLLSGMTESDLLSFSNSLDVNPLNSLNLGEKEIDRAILEEKALKKLAGATLNDPDAAFNLIKTLPFEEVEKIEQQVMKEAAVSVAEAKKMPEAEVTAGIESLESALGFTADPKDAASQFWKKLKERIQSNPALILNTVSELSARGGDIGLLHQTAVTLAQRDPHVALDKILDTISEYSLFRLANPDAKLADSIKASEERKYARDHKHEMDQDARAAAAWGATDLNEDFAALQLAGNFRK